MVDWLLSLSIPVDQGTQEPVTADSRQSWEAAIKRSPMFFITLAGWLARDKQVPNLPTLLVIDQRHGTDVDDRSIVPPEWLEGIIQLTRNCQWQPTSDEVGDDSDRRIQDVPARIVEKLTSLFHERQFSITQISKLRSNLVGASRQASVDIDLAVIRTGESQRRLSVIQTLANALQQQARSIERHREAKLDAIRQLAYGASHEFNNPLANIATRAQALLRDESDSDRRRLLEMINAQAFRGFDMLANLMHYAAPPAVAPQSLFAGQIALAAWEDIRRWVGDDGDTIPVNWESVPDPLFGPVVGDQQQLLMAYKALIRNATETQSPVSMQLQDVSDSSGRNWVAFTVSDRGKEVSQELLDHACDPFFSGREAGRGLGFGLSLAYQVAKRHEGQLELRVRKSGGLAVTLRVPAATAPESAADPAGGKRE